MIIFAQEHDPEARKIYLAFDDMFNDFLDIRADYLKNPRDLSSISFKSDELATKGESLLETVRSHLASLELA